LAAKHISLVSSYLLLSHVINSREERIGFTCVWRTELAYVPAWKWGVVHWVLSVSYVFVDDDWKWHVVLWDWPLFGINLHDLSVAWIEWFVVLPCRISCDSDLCLTVIGICCVQYQSNPYFTGVFSLDCGSMRSTTFSTDRLLVSAVILVLAPNLLPCL
jgi:hypothetical protein